VILPRRSSPRFAALLIAAGSGLALAGAPVAAFASSGHHQAPNHDLKLNQVNLASDIPRMAPLTDPDLKNRIARFGSRGRIHQFLWRRSRVVSYAKWELRDEER
jgi:hypothetical protein